MMLYRTLIYLILLLFITAGGLVIWMVGGQANIDYKTVGIFMMLAGAGWFIMVMYLESRLEDVTLQLKGVYRDYYFLPKAMHKGKVMSHNVAIKPEGWVHDGAVAGDRE